MIPDDIPDDTVEVLDLLSRYMDSSVIVYV